MTRDETIAVLCGYLSEHSAVNLAILYGSVAAGTYRTDSDIDLAVADTARSPILHETLIDISLSCGRLTGREVQVRDLAPADGLFLKQVLTKGVVLTARVPAVRAELIIRMLDFDADMLPSVRVIRRAHRERFIAGS